MTVTLVEPFGLHADAAALRLTALDPHQEHPHGIGQRIARLGGAVHLVAAFGRSEMREAGTTDHQMGGILMIDRAQETNAAQVNGIAGPIFSERGK